jgi:hypothetical protein
MCIPVIPAMREMEIGGKWSGKSTRPNLKKLKQKRAGGRAQVIECLPSLRL